MAIGPSGKVTTTGMMGEKPNVPRAPDLRALGKGQPKPEPKAQPQPQQKVQEQQPMSARDQLKQQFPDASEMELTLAERTTKLTDEDYAALQSVLSPSVKNALGKIIPEFKEVMEQFGTVEPNVILPVSVVASYAKQTFGAQTDDEAIQTFMADLASKLESASQPMEQQQTTVPPSQPQGIMASPQNMEQV